MLYEVIFDLDHLQSELKKLEAESAQPNFWNDQQKAQSVLKEKKRIETLLNGLGELSSGLEDAATLFELAQEEKDPEVLKEVQSNLEDLSEKITQMELNQLLSGEHDFNNAIISITPGAGGTESQDWAQMLLRMYMRWVERRGYKKEVLDFQAGEEAGVKGVTILVSGDYAYGYLKAEGGVHRLVRISPFDTNERRHTSFASVFVYPEMEDNIEIEINPADLRIDVYRASGPGGQGVNTTDSAVRITHLPTNVVVQCQSERSQHKNKATAMKILKSRLYEKKKREEEEKLSTMHKEKKDIAWGSQIRSYVMHPYQMVKDHRTKIETSNVDNVMDGDIDDFIKAFLLKKP